MLRQLTGLLSLQLGFGFRVSGFRVQGLGVRSPKLQTHGINKLEVRRPAKVRYWVGVPSTLRLGRID